MHRLLYPYLRHPYLRFRIRLADHALRQFIASVISSAEITLLVFGPMLFGLLALMPCPVCTPLPCPGRRRAPWC